MTRTGGRCAGAPIVTPVISAFFDSSGHELGADRVAPDMMQHGLVPSTRVEPRSVKLHVLEPLQSARSVEHVAPCFFGKGGGKGRVHVGFARTSVRVCFSRPPALPPHSPFLMVTHTRLVMPARQPLVKVNVTAPVLAATAGLARLPSTVNVGSVASRRVRLRMHAGAVCALFFCVWQGACGAGMFFCVSRCSLQHTTGGQKHTARTQHTHTRTAHAHQSAARAAAAASPWCSTPPTPARPCRRWCWRW